MNGGLWLRRTGRVEELVVNADSKLPVMVKQENRVG